MILSRSFKLHAVYLCIIAGLLTALSLNPNNSYKHTGPDTVAVKTLASDTFINVSAEKSFIDAAEDAAFAISERNFRITNTLRIGNAIRERGNITFPENDVILFCNIQYAESMLELEPDYINYCPGQITVREISANEVIISAPLVPLHPDNQQLNVLVNEVNQLISESVEFAAENWQTSVQ